MKTKALKFFGVAAMFAVALFVNASVNTDRDLQDVKLIDLANVTEANAECPTGSIQNGRCNWSGTRCVLNPFPEDQDCDFYAMP